MLGRRIKTPIAFAIEQSPHTSARIIEYRCVQHPRIAAPVTIPLSIFGGLTMSTGNDEVNQDERKRQEPADTGRKSGYGDNPLPGDTIPPTGEPPQQDEDPDDGKSGQSGDRTKYQDDKPQGRNGKAIVHPEDDGAADSDDETAQK
jgi:hypothetical protein